MELRRMTEAELTAWYENELTTAFPPNERKPREEIWSLLRGGFYEPLGLFSDGALLGYAMMLRRPEADYVLLDYLGVTAARRNSGLGAELLRRLGERYAALPGILAEAELPVPGGNLEENALRARRLGFYERCGFRPVYEIGACGIRLQGIVLGDVPADLGGMMADHRTLYGPERTDVTIPLGPMERPAPSYWLK